MYKKKLHQSYRLAELPFIDCSMYSCLNINIQTSHSANQPISATTRCIVLYGKDKFHAICLFYGAKIVALLKTTKHFFLFFRLGT